MTKVLIVDDNDTQHELFRCYALAASEMELVHAVTLEQAVECLDNSSPDIVLLDNRLPPYSDCGQTLPRIRETGFLGKIVVISSDIDANLIANATKYAADDIVDKFTFNMGNFESQVSQFLQ